MPYNGSGVYTLPSNSFNPAVANTEIDATDWNTSADDLETALSSVITKDGQTTTTASIPFAAGVTINNTGLKVYDTNSSHTLAFVPGSDLTANRTLTLTTGDANRTISMAGNLTFAGSITSSGAFPITLTATAATSVTLPTSGTLLSTGSPSAYVASITGTANEITASAATGAVTLSLPSALTFTGKTITGGSYVTPALGVATGTSLALNGATLGSNALAVTGTYLYTQNGIAAGNFTGTRSGQIKHNFTNDHASGQVELVLTGGATKQLVVSAGGTTWTGLEANADVLTLIGDTGVYLGTSTGSITLADATTLSAALTYGGVALSPSVTGTGSMVLSASPTFTGTAVFSLIKPTGSVGVPASNGDAYAGATTANGLQLIGKGSSYDVALYNSAGNYAARVPTGTTTFECVGALKLGNAYVATPQVTTGYVTIVDSAGVTYKVLVAA